jgi:hypothetical protein
MGRSCSEAISGICPIAEVISLEIGQDDIVGMCDDKEQMAKY